MKFLSKTKEAQEKSFGEETNTSPEKQEVILNLSGFIGPKKAKLLFPDEKLKHYDRVTWGFRVNDHLDVTIMVKVQLTVSDHDEDLKL